MFLSSLPCKSNQTAHFLGISQIPIDHNQSTDGLRAWLTRRPSCQSQEQMDFDGDSPTPAECHSALLWENFEQTAFLKECHSPKLLQSKLDYWENGDFNVLHAYLYHRRSIPFSNIERALINLKCILIYVYYLGKRKILICIFL